MDIAPNQKLALLTYDLQQTQTMIALELVALWCEMHDANVLFRCAISIPSSLKESLNISHI